MAAQQQRAAATLLQRQQQQQAAQQQQHQQHQQISPATQTGSIRGRNRLMPKASLPNPVAMRNASLGQNALPRSQIPGMNLPNHYSLSTNAGGAAGQFLQVMSYILQFLFNACCYNNIASVNTFFSLIFTLNL